MPPTVSRASSNGPSRFTRMVSRQTAGSCSHTSRSCAEPMPWLTTSASTGPSLRSVSATAKAQPSEVPRSAATYSRPTAASSAALRATIITRAPARASSSAASRPMPRPPPVTSATRPFMRTPRVSCSPHRPTVDLPAQSFQQSLLIHHLQPEQQPMRTRTLRYWLIAIAALGSMAAGVVAAADDDKEGDFKFRFVGPRVGNRIAAVAGVPGDGSVYYAGAASGGVWKSSDGGNRWAPVFDKQDAAAIGALAVSPSEPATVWAGTGEAWVIRDSDVMGNGIYKSTDAGKTWTNMGLADTGRIGRIVVNPSNPDIVFACALGRATGPQQERGVYRTTDGGLHWERVLFAADNVGCSGLAMDPHNPHKLFAGLWQVELHTYAEFSGGPGSGVYVSDDGGSKWKHIEEHGLPKSPVGKIDVAVAPTNSNRIYALIQTKDQGSLWRSDDGGGRWKAVNYQRALVGRAGYYIRLAVSPAGDNEVYVANSSFHESLDSGENFREVPWGGDTHDIWIDPLNADRFVVTDDGGMNITSVHGRGIQ